MRCLNYDERVRVLIELKVDLSGKLEMMENEEELLCRQKHDFASAWSNAKTEDAYRKLNEAVRKKIKETTEYAREIDEKLLLVSNELKQHIKQNIRVIGAIHGVLQKSIQLNLNKSIMND